MVRERGLDGTAVLSGQMRDGQRAELRRLARKRREYGSMDTAMGNEELVPEEGVEPS